MDRLGSVANRDVREVLGVGLNAAGHLLRAMVREGLLVKTGANPKSTRYERP